MDPALFVLIVIIAVVSAAVLWRTRKVTIIYPPNAGLLYRDGRFVRELEPGRYAYFDFGGRTRVVQVSRAALPIIQGESPVVSRDQFAFRVALSPILEVVDARAFAESQPQVDVRVFGQYFSPQTATHAALQPLTAAAALEAVAGHNLRDLFADPKLLPKAVQKKLADAIPGAKVTGVLLTSITLPPETRKMFTEVERSKIEAEAALERARGEQAAMRALANAARLIKDNPALANLRFLQTLEHAPGAKTFVLGAGAMPPGLTEPST